MSVLRARICSLETENEQLQNSNKQLTIAKMAKKAGTQSEAELKSKIALLEKQLAEARKLVISLRLFSTTLSVNFRRKIVT